MAEKLVFELTAVDRATAPLRQVTQQIHKTTGAIRAQSSAYNASAVSINKWAKGALQQAGYQVGDFFVQVTNGTSAVQAFGQQGAQMMGVFGPIGAVLGAGVAIAASIGVAFEKTAKKAKTLNDSIDSMRVLGGELESALSNLAAPLDDLIEKYGQGAAAAREFAVLQAVSTKIMSQRGLSDQVGFLDSVIGKYSKATRVVSEFGEEFDVSSQIRAVSKDLDVSLPAAVKLQQAFAKISDSTTFEQQVDAVQNLQRSLEAANVPMEKLPDDLLLTFRDMAKIAQEQLWIEELVRKIDGGVGGSIARVRKETEELVDALKPLAQAGVDVGRSIQASMSSALMSMVDGTKSVKDAFRDMAKSIIMKLYEVLVVQRIVNAAMGFLTGKFPGLGNASLPIAGARAMGGQVTAGRPYLVGERGPEIVVPSRNASVTPNNQIGGGVVVNQTINVTTGVQQTVRAEIKTLLPQIAEASKNAVLDARMRGGSYGRAFA